MEVQQLSCLPIDVSIKHFTQCFHGAVKMFILMTTNKTNKSETASLYHEHKLIWRNWILLVASVIFDWDYVAVPAYYPNLKAGIGFYDRVIYESERLLPCYKLWLQLSNMKSRYHKIQRFSSKNRNSVLKIFCRAKNYLRVLDQNKWIMLNQNSTLFAFFRFN